MRGSFKTLSVYQDALHLVNLSYELIKIFPKQEKYNLSDQLLRACTSVDVYKRQLFIRFRKLQERRL